MTLLGGTYIPWGLLVHDISKFFRVSNEYYDRWMSLWSSISF